MEAVGIVNLDHIGLPDSPPPSDGHVVRHADPFPLGRLPTDVKTVVLAHLVQSLEPKQAAKTLGRMALVDRSFNHAANGLLNINSAALAAVTREGLNARHGQLQTMAQDRTLTNVAFTEALHRFGLSYEVYDRFPEPGLHAIVLDLCMTRLVHNTTLSSSQFVEKLNTMIEITPEGMRLAIADRVTALANDPTRDDASFERVVAELFEASEHVGVDLSGMAGARVDAVLAALVSFTHFKSVDVRSNHSDTGPLGLVFHEVPNSNDRGAIERARETVMLNNPGVEWRWDARVG